MSKRRNKKKKRRRKLQQQNVVTRDNGNETNDEKIPVQVKNQRLLYIVSRFLQKWAFPFICIVYSLFLSTSFIDNNGEVRFIMSLFMALLSLSISIVFSGFSEKYIENIMSRIPIKNLLTIMGLCQFFFAVGLTYILWNLLISNMKVYNHILNKGTIGDILTWLSILIFFIDKNIKK